MVTLDNGRSRMSEGLRLRDYRDKTQRSYLLAVRQLLQWLDREPATWTEEDIRRYFLYLREAKEAAPSSINVAWPCCTPGRGHSPTTPTSTCSCPAAPSPRRAPPRPLAATASSP